MVIIIRQPQAVSYLLCELFHYYTPQVGAQGYENELWPWQYGDAVATQETLECYFTATGHLRITGYMLERLFLAFADLWGIYATDVLSALEAHCGSPVRFVVMQRWNTMLAAAEHYRQEQVHDIQRAGPVHIDRVIDHVYLCLRAQTLQSRILRRFGIVPHLVHFESFVQDIPANFAKLCAEIGVPCAPVGDIVVQWDTRGDYPHTLLEVWMDDVLVEIEDRLRR